MNVVTAARGVAAALSLIMAVYLAVDGAHRPANLFLWPDVAVAVFLAVAAALPARRARAALIFAFGWSGGVLTTSVFGYVVRGEFAWPNFGLVLVSVGMAVLLAVTGERERHGGAARGDG
ncbi:hypothetical protein AB0I81_26165 [Nonomuraea sp. NPDC050404]|uniref:hypothetical protein n=1 Tax=Nonomuraea sp. NPDC050404 TaxID=3155783 RepID=UPI0033F0E9E9